MKMMKFLGLSLHSFHIHLSLGGDAALGVGDLDAESLGLGDDVDALAGGDGAGDPVFFISIVYSVVIEVMSERQVKRTQRRRCGCASTGAQRPWGCGRGKPCGRRASCAWSSCWIRSRWRAWGCCHGSVYGRGCRYPWACAMTPART